MRAVIHPLAVTVIAHAIILWDKQGFVVSVVAYDSLPGHHVIEEIFPFINLGAVSVLRLPDCLQGYATMLFRVVRPMKWKSSHSAYFA
jgi:hypothetical protein